jgi:DNA topoisomerase-3
MKKFGRKFSAYLVMGADGKTTFEFEPRKEGAAGKKPFHKKEAAPKSNGHTEGGSVMPKNVIKARSGARKRAAKKLEGQPPT